MWTTPRRPKRWIGLLHHVERARPSRATARRLGGMRRFLFVASVPDDEQEVRPVLDLVEHDGHVLWIDHVHLPSGASYATDAAAALRACRGMLALCSARAYASIPVRREIEAAFRLGKPIVPIVLDDARMPDIFAFYLERWPVIRLDDPHWKIRLRSATEALARGQRRWQGSPPISAECAPVLVVS